MLKICNSNNHLPYSPEKISMIEQMSTVLKSDRPKSHDLVRARDLQTCNCFTTVLKYARVKNIYGIRKNVIMNLKGIIL